ELPPALAAIVRRMMAKDRTARFQTAAEVGLALAAFATEGTTSWVGDGKGTAMSGETAGDRALLDSDLPRLDTTGFDEIAALARTLTPDPSPTPLSSSWMVRGGTGGWQQHRVLVAVALAAAIVLGGILLTGIISLFL